MSASIEDRGVEETALRAYVDLVPDPSPDHLAHLRRDVLTRIITGTSSSVAGRGYALPTRRLVLAAAAVALVAGAAGVAHTLGGGATSTGGASASNSPDIANREPGATPGTGSASALVLVPVAYQFESDAAPAGSQLRALADNLVDAPYENHTGRYTYHHTKVWGDPVMTSSDGRYHASLASETKVWQASDGSGKQVTTQLGAQFPDQESQEYWQSQWQGNPKAERLTATGAPDTLALPPGELAPLPSDRAGLSELLKVRFGVGAVSKEVSTVYGGYAVPRQTRAEILRILADVRGFVWRGEVTDRAGRNGVAITFDDREHRGQSLLIFDPKTGELLAHERLTLSPVRISAYQVILATDRTNQLG